MSQGGGGKKHYHTCVKCNRIVRLTCANKAASSCSSMRKKSYIGRVFCAQNLFFLLLLGRGGKEETFVVDSYLSVYRLCELLRVLGGKLSCIFILLAFPASLCSILTRKR